MGYHSLADCVTDLEQTGRLVRLPMPVDARLEAAAIHRRVCAAGGPALLFANVVGCRFPMVSNLFGTVERIEYLFRDTLDDLRRLVELKADPARLAKSPLRYAGLWRAGWRTRPKWRSTGPILQHQTTLDQLPGLVSWPRDGGPFVTLPAVYTEDPDRLGVGKSNLGMYRIQLGGNQYRSNEQAGMHYQLHRGIGVHHAAAVRRGEPLRVNVIVGGPPCLPVSAVMPLPEGMPELHFAGVLGGRRLEVVQPTGVLPMPAQADFCIVGHVDPQHVLPEGPFGDHLGYYSLTHDFPVLTVERVYHRPNAIWPFTVVGRPPQEDTTFGKFIHDLTGPALPTVLPGVKAVHAVDAAGVHPLLLAIGKERYVPYAAERTPQELHTIAHAILGQGQLSLAKYLFIVAAEDDPQLDIHDIGAFLRHLLERLDPRVDLHFSTCTTIDTLDYSGVGLNAGSKVVFAAAGRKRRELPSVLPSDLQLPAGFANPRIVMPGILTVSAPAWAATNDEIEPAVARFCSHYTPADPINAFTFIVLVDDSDFVSRSLHNFLWVTFTRSNPAIDIAGIGAISRHKHWGCAGAIVIDARTKPHHAPPLEEDPAVTRKIEALAATGQPLHGLW